MHALLLTDQRLSDLKKGCQSNQPHYGWKEDIRRRIIPRVITAEPEPKNESKDEIDEEWWAGWFIHDETYVYLLISGLTSCASAAAEGGELHASADWAAAWAGTFVSVNQRDRRHRMHQWHSAAVKSGKGNTSAGWQDGSAN